MVFGSAQGFSTNTKHPIMLYSIQHRDLPRAPSILLLLVRLRILNKDEELKSS